MRTLLLYLYLILLWTPLETGLGVVNEKVGGPLLCPSFRPQSDSSGSVVEIPRAYGARVVMVRVLVSLSRNCGQINRKTRKVKD